MKLKPTKCLLGATEIKEDFVLHLCDNPYKCEGCTGFLFKMKKAFMSEWYIDNTIMKDILSIKMELEYKSHHEYLLRIYGVISFMNEIHSFFTETQKKIFHKRGFLLQNRLLLDKKDNKVKIEFTLLFPPVNKMDTYNGYLIDVFKMKLPDFIISSNILTADNFEPEKCSPELYDPKSYDEIFNKLENELGAIQNKVETTYLYTWGTFNFDFSKSNGFSCNELSLNDKNLQAMNINVPE
jgi:hypothetical protein